MKNKIKKSKFLGPNPNERPPGTESPREGPYYRGQDVTYTESELVHMYIYPTIL